MLTNTRIIAFTVITLLMQASRVCAADPTPIEESVRAYMKAIDAGDRTATRRYVAPEDTRLPVVIFDYDWSNKPVTIEGLQPARKYLETILDDMEKEHVKVVSSISNFHGGFTSPDLGYATFQLTQDFPINGKPQTSKFNVTVVVTYDSKEQTWRFLHWHATLVSTEPQH